MQRSGQGQACHLLLLLSGTTALSVLSHHVVATERHIRYQSPKIALLRNKVPAKWTRRKSESGGGHILKCISTLSYVRKLYFRDHCFLDQNRTWMTGTTNQKTPPHTHRRNQIFSESFTSDE